MLTDRLLCRSVAETKDDTEGIDTQHLQTLEKLKQTQRLEHQKVRLYCCCYDFSLLYINSVMPKGFKRHFNRHKNVI